MEPSRPETRAAGLTSEQARQSREQHGSNLLTPPKRPSLWKLYLEKFNDPIIRILLVAAGLSLAIGYVHNDFMESIGIFCAVFLATGIGFYFEYDAARRFEVLNALGQEDPVTVVRDGRVTQIPKSEVVVGDTVLLEQGVEVPADGVLTEAVSLQINESSLTGEAIVSKTTDEAHFDKEATYPSNEVLRSTMVADGHGIMCVKAVGDRTEIGKVARQATKLTGEATPLNRQLERLAKVISKIAFTVAIVAFVAMTAHELLTIDRPSWLDIAEIMVKNFMMAVALIVMAVPEGLPMAVTLSLALNMRRMLKTNNLVRKMHACETMGAINVICTDKTGTLTQNKMQVSELVTAPGCDAARLYEGIAMNSTAHLEADGKSGVGNPTECALLLWMQQEGQDYRTLRKSERVVAQLTFSTERKYMATLTGPTATGRRILYVKGAPEIVASHCDMGDSERDELAHRLRGYQQQAMRTLAFACRETDEADGTDCKELVERGGLTFQGVAAINDPVREEVPAAVAACTSAGISVKIVTGDTSGTAIEIARRIGLWKDSDSVADHSITGPEFAALTDDEALNRVERLKVMSRARPMDKQRLVQLLQQRGAVVAVTGDGTNDAPALNHAQVGLSMGTGTSIAKEASDITLLDDSFRSIATAVMWGRSLYKNIQRFILFQLTINFVALLVVLIGTFIGTDLPLTVTQMLWVNIIMDTFAAMALSSIPPSEQVMNEKPRKTDDFILTKSIKQHIFFTGMPFLAALLYALTYFNREGGASPVELTAFFTFFVLLQFWNLLNAKAFGSNESAFSNLFGARGVLLVMLLILVGQWLIVTFGGRVFRTVPLDAPTWALLLGISSLTLWVGELFRLIKRIASK